MRALRTLAFSAAVFSFFIPLAAEANFQTVGAAPASTLPAFQSQATPYSQASASVSNPANYYGAQVASAAPLNLQPAYAQPQPFGKPSYAFAPLSANGSDPGVGPVMIEGNAVKPVLIEGQGMPQFQQVGYGYAPVGGDSITATPPAQPQMQAQQQLAQSYGAPGYNSAVYGSQAYGSAQQPASYSAQGASSGYGAGNAYPQAPAPAYGAQQQAYGAQAYGAQAYAPPQGQTAYGNNVPSTSAYASNSYGMSGYAPTYGAAAPSPYGQMQTSPGMLSGAPSPGGYAPAPQQQAYNSAPAAPAYGSGSYGSGSYAAAPPPQNAYVSNYSSTYSTPAPGMEQQTTSMQMVQPQSAPQMQQPVYPNYGGGTAAQAYGGGYGAGYGASPTPQPAYGYGGYGGYGAPASGYAPQPQMMQPQQQPDYASQGYGSYAPYSAPQPPANSYDTPAPRMSTMDYTPSSKRGMYDSGAVSLGAAPGGGRYYFALRTGMSFPQNTGFTDLVGSFNTSYKTGWEIGGAAGYEFPSLFGSFLMPRAELEVSSHMASVDQHIVGGVPIKDPNAFGETNSIRLFANGYFDFDTPLRRWFTPYIGGGFGLGFVDYDRHGTTPSGVDISDSDSGLAYNVGGGLSFPLFTRGTSVDVGYRYSQVLGLEFTALDGTKSKTDVGSHEITFSLRQRF